MTLRWWQALIFGLVAVGAIWLVTRPSDDGGGEPQPPITVPNDPPDDPPDDQPRPPDDPPKPPDDQPKPPDDPPKPPDDPPKPPDDQPKPPDDQPKPPDDPPKPPDDPPKPPDDQPKPPDDPPKPPDDQPKPSDDPPKPPDDQPAPPEADPLLATARGTGDARTALGYLLMHPAGLDTRERRDAVAALRFEIGPLDGPVPEDHPQRDAIEAERAVVADGQDAFLKACTEKQLPTHWIPRLEARLSDETAAAWINQFFPGRKTGSVYDADEPLDRSAATVWARASELDARQRGIAAIGLGRRFVRNDRPRARLRWLLRAWAYQPTVREYRRALIDAFISQSRLHEALAVLGAEPTPDDPTYYRERAKICGWLSLTETEADAWSQIPEDQLTPPERMRILALLMLLGRGNEALDTALALARSEQTPAAWRRVVNLATTSGAVDEAIEFLLEAAESLDPGRPWLEEAYQVALQDLRQDQALEILKQLLVLEPNGRLSRENEGRTYLEEVERLLLLRGDEKAVIEFLEGQLTASTDAAQRRKIRSRLLDLHATQGAVERVKVLLEDALDESRSADELAHVIPLARIWGLPPIGDDVVARLADAPDEPDVLARAYEVVSPALTKEQARTILRAWSERHPTDKRLRALYLFLLDEIDPVKAAKAAEERYLADPGNLELLTIWVERTSWIDDPPQQTRAREELRRLRPGDMKNRRQLAQLYEQFERYDAAVVERRVVAQSPEGTPADLRAWAAALIGAERPRNASKVMDQLLETGKANWNDRLLAADLHLAFERYPTARAIYLKMLEDHPGSAHVYLRMAQSHVWAGEPTRGRIWLDARPPHRGGVRGEERIRDDAQASMIRGEQAWTEEQRAAARRCFLAVIREVALLRERNLEDRVLLGRAHLRLQNTRLGRGMFEEILADSEDLPNRRMDYGDALLAVEDFAGAARQLAGATGSGDPDTERRRQRLTASLDIQQGRYEQAACRLSNLRATGPVSTGLLSDLGNALREAGALRSARHSFARALHQGGFEAWSHRAFRDLGFELGPTGTFTSKNRWAGVDRLHEQELRFHMALPEERVTASGFVSYRSERGFAEGAPGDRASEDYWTVGAEIDYRFFRRSSVFVSGAGFLGRSAGPSTGWRAGLRWLEASPYTTVNIEGRYDVPLDEVGAGMALGGRKRGVRVQAYRDIGKWHWVNGTGSYDRVSIIDPVGGDRISDGLAVFGAEVGRWLCRGDQHIGVRVGYSGLRLLDDKSLSRVVPIGDRFDLVTGGVRITRDWKQVVDGTLEVFAGTDASAPGLLWGARADLRLDFSRHWRAELRGEFASQDRYREGESGSLEFRILGTP